MKITFLYDMEVQFLDGTFHSYKKGDILPFVSIFDDSSPFDREKGFCHLAFSDGKETHSIDKSHINIDL